MTVLSSNSTKTTSKQAFGIETVGWLFLHWGKTIHRPPNHALTSLGSGDSASIMGGGGF